MISERQHVLGANETPTVYDWAGGSEAFDRLTEIFYRNHGLI